MCRSSDLVMTNPNARPFYVMTVRWAIEGLREVFFAFER